MRLLLRFVKLLADDHESHEYIARPYRYRQV
jgi:hypothetical protein